MGGYYDPPPWGALCFVPEKNPFKIFLIFAFILNILAFFKK